MKKHRLNFYPEASPEIFAELREGIDRNGYDKAQPIVTYQGEILDGWNRQKACDDLGVRPTYRELCGDDTAALEFVISTNRRRDLNKGQRAILAVKAGDLRETIAAKAKDAQIRKPADSVSQKIDQQNHNGGKTDQKLGDAFGVNRTYVNQATKLTAQAPEIAAKVEAGKMTLQDGLKEVRKIPTDPWMDDEKERRAQVESGKSVVANAQRCKNLIAWAEKKGLAVQIGRGSPYGNPFILGKDGDRDAVCDHYRDYYLPHKPSIQTNDLKGKVLVCHCYPERCHGESLI